MADDALDKLRDKIDAIDEQLLELFNQRASCAVEVAEVKREFSDGADDSIDFFRPDREAQVIQRIKSLNQGPLSNDEVGRLIREVMSACLALEQPLRIAYLGPEGTFTQSAALKHFGHSVSTIPMSSIPDVFSSVESGHADYGLVPVENSTEGVISHTLDMFIDSGLKVCGEVEIRVHHHLASKSQDVPAILRPVPALARPEHAGYRTHPGQQQCRSRAPCQYRGRRGGNLRITGGGDFRIENLFRKYRGPVR
jgi:chorismate mutase/prephenate dehydratase